VIRLCLVDDQQLVRHGIRTLLELLADIEVVAEAADGDAAIAAIVENAPDVVLLDLRMPGRDGLGVLAELRARGRLPPTIVLTTFDEDQLLLDALRLGARGFLLKDVSLERLSAAIRAVAAGGSAIQPGLTERLLEAGSRGGWEETQLAPSEPLTERETEVLRMLVGGLSNREIGDALAMAEGTVKNHLSSILGKLGVRDRTRAVLKALAERLV
jgi:DNA-binding NarL/FixJ family response regulator